MRNPAVNQVHFSHPFVESFDSRKDLRDHPTVDDVVLYQLRHIFPINGRDKRVGIFHVPHDTHHVTNIDHFGGLQGASHRPCSHVSIDIEDGPLFGLGDRRNDRHHLPIDRLTHTAELERSDLADKPNVNQSLSVVLSRQSLGFKDVPSGKAFRHTDKRLHSYDKSRPDYGVKNLLDDLDRHLVGDPESIDKPW